MSSSFLFRWPHPASEVFVTGTFDDWGKTVRLDKKGNVFEKLVHLPETAKNIYYKFVVDGNWTTDHTAPQERDGQNHLNNVLTPDQMDRSQQPQAAASSLLSSVISSVTPQSTTAALAQDAPLESKADEDRIRMPSHQPQTAASSLLSSVISSVRPQSTTAALAQDAPLESKADENRARLPSHQSQSSASSLLSSVISSVTPQSTTTALAQDAPLESKVDENRARVPSHQPQSSAQSILSSVISSVTPRSTTASQAKDVPLESEVDEDRVRMMPGGFPMTPAQERSEFKPEPQTLDLPGGFPSTPAQERSEPPMKPDAQQTPSRPTASGTADAPDQGLPAQERATPNAKQDAELPEGSDGQRQQQMESPHGDEDLRTARGTDDRTSKGIDTPSSNEVSRSAQHPSLAPNPITNTAGLSQKKQSTSKTEDSEPRFGVNPLPATAGIGNPIKLTPGANVPDPSTFTTNTINSSVTLDKESYERGGSASGGFPMLPPVVTPQDERDRKGTGVLDLPPITKNLIPESSLPMGGESRSEKDPGAFLSSAGPSTSTAELASKVPLEPHRELADVPEIVKESQQEAHVDPEASVSAEAVEEKRAVEDELTREVKPTPPTTEGVGHGDGARSANQSDAADTPRGIPPSVLQSIQQMNLDADHSSLVGHPRTAANVEHGPSDAIGREPTVTGDGDSIPTMQPTTQGIDSSEVETTAPGVPEVVSKSLNQAHQSPEAAANYEAVAEKRAVEQELLAEVKPAETAGQPAPALSAALSDSAPTPTRDAKPELAETESPYRFNHPVADVRTAAPTFTGYEQETQEPTLRPDDLAARATTPAINPATREAASRTIQPQGIASSSKETPPTPMVTTGVNSGTTETHTPQRTTAPATSSASTPQSGHLALESPGSSTSKKEKRKSGFFGKLKEKFRR
ncbi:MAG: hypothetical protein M1816_007712 [Peltula sp. TS41687]|nr:MAG: hypothetical protein M1816_007712 [Peltula sp. TS41687]